MIEEEKNQFAVLIDADNISPKYAPIIFQELEAYGFPSCLKNLWELVQSKWME